MDTLRIALIGTGTIARGKHIPCLLKRSDVKITVLCDIDVEKAEKVKADFGLTDARVCSNYHEVCQDPDIDVIHVLTPNPLHYPITMEALENGKHVHCEKPIACKYSDAKEMIETAKRVGKKLTSGTQWRYQPAPLKMKEMIRDGVFGDIYYIKSSQLRGRLLPAYGVYTSKTGNGGGMLMDGGPHSIDLPMWLTDNYDVQSVRGVTFDKMKYHTEGNPQGAWDPDHFDVEDSFMAMITMKNGMLIYVECAWVINMLQEAPGMVASIAGTKAGADMVGPGFETTVRVNSIVDGKLSVDSVECSADCSMHEYDINHWIDAIKNDTDPAVLPEQAAVLVRVIEAIYKSAATGQTVFFD